MVLALLSFKWKMLSMTDSSVLVVSDPQNAQKSFTTSPAAITSEPLFTVPAYWIEKKYITSFIMSALDLRAYKIVKLKYLQQVVLEAVKRVPLGLLVLFWGELILPDHSVHSTFRSRHSWQLFDGKLQHPVCRPKLLLFPINKRGLVKFTVT